MSTLRSPIRAATKLPHNRSLLWVAAIVLLWSGCNSNPTSSADSSDSTPSSPQPSWSQLVAAAQQGDVDRIEVNVPVSDSDLDQVANLGQLKILHIEEGVITDAGVIKLEQLSSLTHLRLRMSPVTDASCPTLRKLESLQFLNLPQAKISAEGIRQLAGHKNLLQLRIGSPNIDDEACAAMIDLPELRYVHLIAPKLTPMSLDHLAKIRSLQSLYIDQCDLPPEAWESFFQARPDVHVHLDQAHHDLDPNMHQHTP